MHIWCVRVYWYWEYYARFDMNGETISRRYNTRVVK